MEILWHAAKWMADIDIILILLYKINYHNIHNNNYYRINNNLDVEYKYNINIIIIRYLLCYCERQFEVSPSRLGVQLFEVETSWVKAVDEGAESNAIIPTG